MQQVIEQRGPGLSSGALRLVFWTICTLCALWSFAVVAGTRPGMGPGQAAAQPAPAVAGCAADDEGCRAEPIRARWG